MNHIKDKARWKIYLAIFGVIIIVISMIYTNYLVDKLRTEERKKMEIYRTAQEQFQKAPDDADMTLIGNIMTSNNTIPVLLVDEQGNIQENSNWSDTSRAYLEAKLLEIRKNGPPPIEAYAAKLYYTDSRILTLLKYLPWIQFLLISAFIAAGYFSFSSARRAEQNRVWVGMAKETAHQLGTPISAIIAWIETLRYSHENNPETQEILTDLTEDVSRLELIAERFSKIGSEPELASTDILTELLSQRDYMKKRSSRHVTYTFPDASDGPVMAKINAPLFNWVIENLLRNALDAMKQEGEISASIEQTEDAVKILIADSGKGISAKDLKTVFEPGYTTKKRGWGLGLSLAKRIIEQYHGGRIYVAESIADQGTTFAIELQA